MILRHFLAALFFAATLPVSAATFSIEKNDSGLVIKHDGKPVASYVLDQANKPYLWPVFGPTGKSMTRAYPMETVEGEQHDHPHHRGILFGHESIGGYDTWAEKTTYQEQLDKGKNIEKSKTHLAALGTIKHREFTELKANDKQALIREICDYIGPDGSKTITEERLIVFHFDDDNRMIDFDQDLIASEGNVHFAERKDAGLCIRVPTSMAVESKLGGKIINSEGQTDDAAWSKPATWCDYHGPVEGENLGVAMLNNPSSFNYPSRWHVRGYGLFTANPFASKEFDPTLPDSSFDLKKGERLKLRHRFVFHKGDEKEGRIAEAFDTYSKEKH